MRYMLNKVLSFLNIKDIIFIQLAPDLEKKTKKKNCFYLRKW